MLVLFNHMKNQKVAFYLPNGNNYQAELSLWCIAREDRTNSSERWLETSWIGSAGHGSGLALFCSKLDAYIQCIRMNADGDEALKGKWKVYSFSDLNRLEMSINMKFNYGHEMFGFSLIFGFASSADGTLLSRNGIFAPVSYHLDVSLDTLIEIGKEETITFPSSNFKLISELFDTEVGDYLTLVREVNKMSHKTINDLAIQHFKKINFQCPDHSPSIQEERYASSCFLSLGWKTVQH
ncbi:hypothetical protein MW350_004573 [Vibrio parahaemolyticus]|nr:hypothetical protein [Vibrio parahaemolyticus]